MKLSLTTFISAALLITSTKSDLASQWNIGDVSADDNVGNLFTFNYDLDETWITDIDTQVQVTMYDFACKTSDDDTTYGKIGINDSPFTDTSPFEMTSLGYDGETASNLQLKFTTVPLVMANLPLITTQPVNGTSEMKFCVRISLFAVLTTEVNFQETEVTMIVNMSDNFNIDSFKVSQKGKTDNTASQGYQVTTELCPDQPTVFNQGSVIKVCISPGGNADSDGVVLKSVDTFEWTRSGVPSQTALNGPNIDAEDGLSVVTLYPDEKKIMIETVIYSAFYVSDGEVSANGSASMGFTNSRRRGRRLNNDNVNKRYLQDVNDVVPFEIIVPVLKGGGVGISVTTVAIIVFLVTTILLA